MRAVRISASRAGKSRSAGLGGGGGGGGVDKLKL